MAPERVPSVTAAGAASVDQAVHALGASSRILVTDGLGKVTFIDGVTLRDVRRQIAHHIGKLGALGFEVTLCRIPEPEPAGPGHTHAT